VSVRASVLGVFGGAAIVLVGCSDPAPEPPPAPAPRSAAQLAPDALLEGRIEAFGLRLPAGSILKRRTPTTLTAEVPARLEATLDYVRVRTKATERKKGKRVFFDDATLVDGPSTKVRIVLRESTVATELTVSQLDAPADDEPVYTESNPPPEPSGAPSAAGAAVRPRPEALEPR
jgi:hypothetical protein